VEAIHSLPARSTKTPWLSSATPRFTFSATIYSLEVSSPECDETRVTFESVNQFLDPEELKHFAKQVEAGDMMPEEFQRYRAKDERIKDYLCASQEWLDACVWILLDAYQTRAVPVRSLASVTDIDREPRGNPILAAFRDHFEITRDDAHFYSLTDICAAIGYSEEKKVSLELQSIGLKKKKRVERKPAEPYQKVWFYGVRLYTFDEPSESANASDPDSHVDKKPRCLIPI
jgi:hypothetical protein